MARDYTPVIMATPAGITAATVVAIVLSAGCGGASTHASPEATVKPSPIIAPSPVEPSPTAASELGALDAWGNGGGRALFIKFGNDFAPISAALDARDFAALRKACVTLQSDVKAAQQYPQIPVASVQQPWGKQLALEARSSADCISAVDAGNIDLITRSAAEITSAGRYTDQVTAAIKALTAHG